MRALSRLTLILLVAAALLALTAGSAGAAPGSIVWKKALNPSPNGDGLYLCAKGPAGSLYACGSVGWPVAAHIWLVKYTTRGGQAWSRTWAGPNLKADEAQDMVVDRAGNVYLTGRTEVGSGVWDSVLLKYDTAGALKWAVVYPVSAQDDEARAIGLDKAGNVYIGGEAYRAGNWDIYTARFRAADGSRQWTSWYDSSVSDSGWTMAVTSAGDTYLAGDISPGAHATDALLVKTTAAGAVAWARTWDDPAGKDDEWETVSLAPSGGVIVAGAQDFLGAGDLVAARYTAGGRLKWARSWSSPGSADDYAVDAAVDRDGGVWVGGITDRGAPGSGDQRGALVKWSASGHRRFAKVIGTAARPAMLHALTLDASGSAYMAGSVSAAGGGWDLLTAKYAAGGKRVWRSTATFGGNVKDSLDDIALGPAGYLFACGSLAWGAADSGATVVKLRR